MYTVKGLYRQGMILPDAPISGREGQKVLITFIETFIENDESILNFELNEVIASIKMLGKNPANIIPPSKSLLDVLAASSNEPRIDSDLWDRQWALLEQKMKERDMADDRAEGRL